MKNPWHGLPRRPPYILREDKWKIDKLDKSGGAKNSIYQIRPEQLPSPFVGNQNAPIVLLNLNPGYKKESSSFLRSKLRKEFNLTIRKNLRHSLRETPFYPLNKRYSSSSQSGYKWWNAKLKPLLEKCPEHLSENVFCVEYFPYHSERFSRNNPRLSSQEYSKVLIHKAINRGAVIIIMRSKALWLDFVPELKKYKNLFILNSPQNVTISPRNLGEQNFKKVITRLSNGIKRSTKPTVVD